MWKITHVNRLPTRYHFWSGNFLMLVIAKHGHVGFFMNFVSYWNSPFFQYWTVFVFLTFVFSKRSAICVFKKFLKNPSLQNSENISWNHLTFLCRNCTRICYFMLNKPHKSSYQQLIMVFKYGYKLYKLILRCDTYMCTRVVTSK